MKKCEVKFMQKYYTAVGRFERKGRMGDMTCPMVIINNREYALDIQEMILWPAASAPSAVSPTVCAG